jgi:hypothetical protein
MVNSKGVHNGKSYEGIIANIEFDHVAFLLDEPPAGEHTYTTNSKSTVFVCNIDMTVHDLMQKVDEALTKKFGGEDRDIWSREIFLDSKTAIFRDHKANKLFKIAFGTNEKGDIVFTGEPFEVIEERIFKPVPDNSGMSNNSKKVDEMDKSIFIPLLIANSHNKFTTADKEKLLSMPDADLVDAIVTNSINTVTVEQATEALEKAGLTVNSKDFDKDGYEQFVANRDEFNVFTEQKEKARTEMIDTIVANSQMTKEDLKSMGDDAVARIAKSLAPSQDFSAMGTVVTNSKDSSTPVVDYS